MPLTHRRVLVPRGGPWGDRVAASLRAQGAEPVVAPMINFAPAADFDALHDAIRRLAAGEFDWVTLTSATTVDVLSYQQAVIPDSTRVAAVGETTAAALTAAGYRVDLVPEHENSASGMLAEWNDIRKGTPLRVLTLRSDIAKPVLSEGLLELGHDVTQVVAYRTVGVPVDPEIVDDVRAGRIGAVLVTSGSVAEQIVSQFGPLPEQTIVACIGPVTAHDAEAAGLHVTVTADHRTATGLIEAVISVADEERE